jgi:type II secretory pathway component GspD/PulD (secretin)
MMKWISLLSLFFACSAFADKAFDINMNLVMNGKQIFAPQVFTLEGKTTTLTTKRPGQDDIFMDVTANYDDVPNTDAINLKFVIGTLDAKGNRKILYSPGIIALENQMAEISVGSVEKKNENLSLSVTANTETY